MFEMTFENQLLVIAIFSSAALLVLEFAYSQYKAGRLAKRADFFNWSFPADRPFSLFVLPLLVLFALHALLLGNLNILLVGSVFSITVQILFEEIAFRGIVFGVLLKHFHDSEKIIPVKFGLLLFAQALIFSLLHYQTKNFIGVFLSALVFGFVFFLSGKNVLPSTILHLAGNLLVFQNDFVLKLAG
jgi:membrane protease YdiL (CAAX protease family)